MSLINIVEYKITDGEDNLKLRTEVATRRGRLRKGLQGSAPGLEAGSRHQSGPGIKVQRNTQAGIVHGQRDQHPLHSTKLPIYCQIHRHAQNRQQFLLRLRVLQRRHTRQTHAEIGPLPREKSIRVLPANSGSVQGIIPQQYHAPGHQARQHTHE